MLTHSLSNKIRDYRPILLPERSEALPITVQVWQRRGRCWVDCARHPSLTDGLAHVQKLRRVAPRFRLVFAPGEGERVLNVR
jgi:hypothetical protein